MALLGVLGGSILFLTGCGTKQPRLKFTSIEGNRVFAQTFPQAYVARTSASDYEVLLISDGLNRGKAKPGAVLETSALMPLRQVVHLRAFWQPTGGIHADHPAATNSAIDWYVFGDPNSTGGEMLHYAGTAFTFVYPKGDLAQIEIRNATLKLKDRRGDLRDVIGESRLEGKFKARRDSLRLADLTTELKCAIEGQPSEFVAVPDGPPPRAPAGP